MKLEKVFGQRTIEFLLNHQPERLVTIYVELNKSLPPKISKIVETMGISVEKIQRKTFDDWFSGSHHQNIAASIKSKRILDVKQITQYLRNAEAPLPHLLVLDQIQDPHNLGAILRTADALGIQHVILSKDNSCSLTSTVHKVACGASHLLDIAIVSNVSQFLRNIKDIGYWIIGTHLEGGQVYHEIDCGNPKCIIMGNEHQGLGPNIIKQCDYKAYIPMRGTVESLNVSVATGIMFQHFI